MIEVAPLAFMRGRTLNDSFIILDEAQNTSPEQMKMFLTRLGFNSKMVVTGDITQIDLPREQDSGLVVVVGHPRRGRGDRVRSLRRARTSSATSSCGGSSPPTTSTRNGWRPSSGRASGPRPELARARRRGDRDRAAICVPAARPAVELEELCALALSSAGIDEGHVAIEFVDEERIRELNREHRQIDEPTDVLSFGDRRGRRTPAGPRELGDIVICPEQTEDLREAVVHGALHLSGMDHETDDGEMLALQAELMRWVQ